MILRRVSSFWKYLLSEGPVRALCSAWNAVTFGLNGLLGRQYVRKRIHGNQMYLRVNDKGVSRALAVFGTREVLETEIFKRELTEGMVIVDLGANIGYYTLLAASMVGAKGKVYAIEPFGDNFSLLQRNIQINRYDSIVETFQLAISDAIGKTRMYLGRANNLHTLIDIDETDGAGKTSVEVQTTTLDRFLEGKRPVDFLRMDIEGGECQVFDGMGRLLKQRTLPKIFFEIHPIGSVDPDPRYTPRLQRLLAAGYHCRYAISSFHPTSLQKYSSLGYRPLTVAPNGQAIFENIKDEHLLSLAARRPKITRALLLAPRSTPARLGEL